MSEEYDLNTIWKHVLDNIKISVSNAIFSTWFSQTHLVSMNKNNERFTVEIGCTSNFVKATIESRYYGLVQDELGKEMGSSCDVLFIIKESPKSAEREDFNSVPLFENNHLQKDIAEILQKAKVRYLLTFENYAVSSSNQMAWAAGEAVSKNPGSAYNPLFIWGGVGVGKTHLMNAIGVEILKKDNEAAVLFCTGEDFTNDIVEGIRNKTTESFRKKYRKLKALMIDDIQFIAGKDAVQEEFFHTFNAIVGVGGQVILTSDRPPSEISKLEERLKSRFEAGLIVDIAPPDFELRCAIIQIKAREKGYDIPMDVVQLIAGNIEAARKIEGFLIRLTTEANLKNLPINIDLAQNLIGKGIDPEHSSKPKATSNEVINAVSKYYSVGKRQLLGASRARPFSLPRQILMYLLRTQLSLPLEEVGRLVGGRDHTTVMHAVDKITTLSTSDVVIRQDIQGIKQVI